MPKLPLIIDCDPGQDDAVALLLAFAASDALDLLGVTVVGGNVGIDLTTRNACRVCELAGRADVAVYRGCPAPLMRPLVTATHVHGLDGLAGVDLPPPTMPVQPQHAVDFMVESLRAATVPVTLATLGPLTNLAVALIKEPAIRAGIARVVLMGGAMLRGNVTPAAEFNVYVDPHAAQVVLNAGVDVVMLGLDVTTRTRTTHERLARLRSLGNRAGAAVADLFHDHTTAEARGDGGGAPKGVLHDACVIAYLLRPELFGGRRANVVVETASELLLGCTLVDWWGVSGRPTNTLVLDTIDADGFFGLLTERLARLP